MKARTFVFVLLVFSPLALIYSFSGPIPQDQAYHHFADTRRLLGVPNFWNVAGNLLFVLFGLMGVRLCRRAAVKVSWLVFFAGAALVGPGSALYHLSPGDLTLVFDRLPMTIAFAGIVSAVVADVFSVTSERILLAATLATGIYSVMHWHLFGDLRLYAWVQLTPMVVLVYIALAYDPAELRRKYLVYAFGWYLLAKVAEHYDALIYSTLGGEMSGHALKHVFASFGILALYLMKKGVSVPPGHQKAFGGSLQGGAG